MQSQLTRPAPATIPQPDALLGALKQAYESLSAISNCGAVALRLLPNDTDFDEADAVIKALMALASDAMQSASIWLERAEASQPGLIAVPKA